MPNTTAPAETKVKLGTPTVSFDGQTFTIPQLIETVRRLMAKNATRTDNPLTHNDVRAIVSEEIGTALRAGFERLQSTTKLDDLHLCGSCKCEATVGDRVQRLLLASVQQESTDKALQLLRSHGFFGDVDSSGVHNSSPSVDGGSSPTVGDGEVAGVEHTAPATDAKLLELVEAVRTARLIKSEARRIIRRTREVLEEHTAEMDRAEYAERDAVAELDAYINDGAA